MAEGIMCGPCWKCGTKFWLPNDLYAAAKHSSKIIFFCPYGHEAVFNGPESEADKLRRERDRLKQQLAQKDDEIALLKDTYVKERRKIIRNVSKSKCPCCTKAFPTSNLQQHIAAKHPEFVAQEVH